MNRAQSTVEPANWLIIGHYGGSNTGDEAMLAGLVHAGRQALGPGSAILTKQGVLSPAVGAAGLSAISPSPSAVWRALRGCDGILLGGGTHFHDDYNPQRYLRHLRYLLRIVALCALARVTGKRVLWLGMGFGPFHRASTRWMTRLGLATCERVTVRDTASLEAISGWVSSSRVDVSFDLAALLPDNSIKRAGAGAARAVLGVSLTSAATSLSSRGRHDRRFWMEFRRALEAEYAKRPELCVKVFVLRGGCREDDRELSDELARSLATVDPNRVTLEDYEPDPRKTLEAIGTCSTFVATRYHAAVLAFLARRPMLCIAYHRKVRDFALEVDLAERACIDLQASAGELRDRLGALLDGDDLFRAGLTVEEAVRRATVSLHAVRPAS